MGSKANSRFGKLSAALVASAMVFQMVPVIAYATDLNSDSYEIDNIDQSAEWEIELDDIIEAIGNIPDLEALRLSDEPLVKLARDLYDLLPERYQAKIAKLYEKLVAAEQRIAQLKEGAEKIIAADKTISVGNQVSLGASLVDHNGKLTFSTSDSSIASVSAEGIVTALAKGTAEITITASREDGVEFAKKFIFVTVCDKDSDKQDMYRLYNPNSGEHFYTASAEERDNLVNLGWNDEGIGWVAPTESDTPVYRLYNAVGGEHHYTTDSAERDNLVKAGWTDEGIGWYSDDDEGVALLREYNPNQFACNHNYTSDKAEHDRLISLGWIDEGVGWYGLAPKEV